MSVVKISPEWVTGPEQVSPVVGLLPLASGPACLGMTFPPFLAKHTVVTQSLFPRSWEQGIPREGEDDSWVGEAMVLRITTPYTPIYWIQHVNRMSLDRLPRIMKHYSPTGRRNRGRPLRRLLDTWHWNGSTSGLTPWQTYDNDVFHFSFSFNLHLPSCYGNSLIG